jgi:hypothetical protein
MSVEQLSMSHEFALVELVDHQAKSDDDREIADDLKPVLKPAAPLHAFLLPQSLRVCPSRPSSSGESRPVIR